MVEAHRNQVKIVTMLENVTQSALSLLSCQLAWLLIYGDEILVTGALATPEPEQGESLLRTLSRHYPDGIFSARMGDNLLADILVRNTPLVGLPVARLASIESSQPIIEAFTEAGLNFVSIVPLRQGEHLMGVLVMGSTSNEQFSSENGHQIVRLLRRQAVLELENVNLIERLADNENQSKAERSFYQVVLDTIGDGLVIADMDGKIRYVSQRLLLMTGYTTNHLLDKSVDMLFAGIEAQALASPPDRASHWSTSQELKTKAGTVVPVMVSQLVARRHDAADENVSVIVISDVSNLRTQEQTLEHQARRLKALNRTFQAIGSPLDLHDVIQVILVSAREVIKAEIVTLFLRDTEDNLVLVARQGAKDLPVQVHQIPVGTGLAGWVAQHAQSLVLDNAPQDTRFDPAVDGIPNLEISAMAVVPLMAYNNIIGVLAATNKEMGFESDDLEFLENLSTSAAIAIENATLFDQTHRRLAELSTLLDASAVVTASVNLNTTLEHISRRLREALDVQRVIVATVNVQTSQITKLAEVVDAQWSPQRAPATPLVEFYSKRSALLQWQATTATLTDLPTADHTELQLRGMRSTLNVPLRHKNQIIGLVSLYGDAPLTSAQATSVEKAIQSWSEQVQQPWDDLTVLCHQALEATNLRWCSVYRWDRTQDTLQLVREMGIASWQNNSSPVQNLEEFSFVQHVIDLGMVQTQTTARLTDFSERNYYRQLGAAACLFAPVRVQKQVVGVVGMMRSDDGEFDDNSFSLAQGIANIIGNALENSALYSSLEKRAHALEAAYREIEKADRFKDELVQNLSHELGTPLTHILGYLSLMEDGAFGDVTTEQQNTLQLAINKTQRVAELIKRMIALYPSNTFRLNLKETHLEQVAALSIRTMTPKARAAKARIIPRIASNLPPANVDQVSISEVFEALLDNAIKFSEGGKLIEVSILDTGGPMLQISVRDEGIGISKEEHDKVFREFYQVDGSMTRKYGGMGLGLSIVQKIVTAHGGRVWLESDPGEGTCVYFTVPKAKFDDPASANQHNALVIS